METAALHQPNMQTQRIISVFLSCQTCSDACANQATHCRSIPLPPTDLFSSDIPANFPRRPIARHLFQTSSFYSRSQSDICRWWLSYMPLLVRPAPVYFCSCPSLFLQLSHFCRRSMTALKTHGSLKTTSVHGQPTGLPCTGGSYPTATCGPLHCVRSGSADADDLAVSVGFIPL